MHRIRVKILGVATVVGLLTSPSPAQTNSVGEFFKALGNSIAHPGQPKKPAPKPQTKKPKAKTSPLPLIIRLRRHQPLRRPHPLRPRQRASHRFGRRQQPPTKTTKRDIPYGIPVPNKPGFVTSPYASKSGYVDVRGFPSGTEVKDPYSGKTFLTP
jgi:hypothetical protein